MKPYKGPALRGRREGSRFNLGTKLLQNKLSSSSSSLVCFLLAPICFQCSAMEFAELMIALSMSDPVFFPFEIQARMPLDDFGVFPLEHSPATLISNLFLIVCVQNVD